MGWTPLPTMESGVCWEFLLMGDSIVTVKWEWNKDWDFEDLFVFSYSQSDEINASAILLRNFFLKKQKIYTIRYVVYSWFVR